MKDTLESNTWMPAPDFLALPQEEVKWIVQDLIPSNTITIFLGLPKNFKTYFTLCLAKAVSNGTEFLGRKTIQTPTLYTDRENPRNLIVQRFNQLEMDDCPNFGIWGKWMKPNPPKSLDDPVYIEAAKTGAVLIFDSMIRFHEFNENKPTEMKKVTASLSHLQDLGATIWIIHHSGKNPDSRHRGTTEIIAGVDVAYYLEKIKKSKGIVKLECCDSRYFPEFDMNIQVNAENGSFSFTDVTTEEEKREEEAKLEKLNKMLFMLRVFIKTHKHPPIQSELIDLLYKNNIGSVHHIRELLIEGENAHWKSSQKMGSKSLEYVPTVTT